MVDFLQKMHIFETIIFDIFDFGTPPTPNKWLVPLNHYIFRKYIPWPCSSFLNYSKIFYSKKVFFVPPEGCQIVKTPNFDPHLAPPTFGGGVWSPYFCDQGPWMYPPYKFGSDPGYFCSCPDPPWQLFCLFVEWLLKDATICNEICKMRNDTEILS